MMKYRGYYIDGVVFKTKAEIDEFLKNAIIKKARVFNDMLMSGRYDASQQMQLSDEISLREKTLHDEYGMDYEEIEKAIYA